MLGLSLGLLLAIGRSGRRGRHRPKA
jgi:hypothetical protein